MSDVDANAERVAARPEQVRALFDRESGRWSRRYEEGGSMQGRVERFAAALAGCVGDGARVLDFGCGAGHIALGLAARGLRVTGCDISPGMLGQARASDEAEAVDWVQLDSAASLRLPFDDDHFDAAVSSSVLEYVEDPGGALAELARVVRPGGWVLVTVPDERHPGRVAESRRIRWVRRPWIRSVLRRTPLRDYVEYLLLSVNRFDIETWSGLVRNAGLEVEPIGPCEDALVMVRARSASRKSTRDR